MASVSLSGSAQFWKRCVDQMRETDESRLVERRDEAVHFSHGPA